MLCVGAKIGIMLKKTVFRSMITNSEITLAEQANRKLIPCNSLLIKYFQKTCKIIIGGDSLKISRLIIKNYRNLKEIDIHLNDTVALIGENNSGKTNLLKAITLPFLSEESGFSSINLSWADINDVAKSEYYDYIIDNQIAIADGTISCIDLISHLPVVTVKCILNP